MEDEEDKDTQEMEVIVISDGEEEDQEEEVGRWEVDLGQVSQSCLTNFEISLLKITLQ